MSEKWLRDIFALIAVWIISGVFGSAHSVAQPPSSSGLPDVENAIVLNPQERVWIDKKNRRLVMDGEICLQKGALELFICPWNGKLHESIVRVHAKPSTVHAGLLALGCQSGAPVSYDEKYTPAHGEAVEIVVRWLDEKGEWQEVHGQDWIRYRDIPADDRNPQHAALIRRAERSTDDQTKYLDMVETFWVPVHPAFTERVKKEPGHVTRPSRAGKQLEQLMILTDPRALHPNPPPEQYYRAQFSPAKRSNSEHVRWIEQAEANNKQDRLLEADRVRARWEPVFPNRKDEIAKDKDNVLRPSPAGKQIEELMIRGQHLDHDWVFAGSRIVKNPETGDEFYVADRSGELACVSNFPTALLDLPIESSSDNALLGFEADEEMIPPKGTPVRVMMMPAGATGKHLENAEQK